VIVIPAAAPDASAPGAAPTSPAAAPAAPRFSLVVPVHDGGEAFERCLSALPGERAGWLEIVVVDDGSADGSGERARGRGLRVLRLDRRGGPAAARNAGARAARGEFLFFLDADCLLDARALERAAAELDADPGLDALFGSYDDRPEAPGAVSRFKNLFHHWVHQRGAGRALTFWAGCGLVRRSTFLALGGFDAARYPEPSIEDIELGYRLSERGGRIRLAPALTVRHLKRWTLGSWLRTDFLRRGVPWTELVLAGRGRGTELNLGWRDRLAVLAGVTAPAALAASAFAPRPLAAAALAAAGTALVALVASSWGLYRLLARRGGAAAALGAVPLHVLYCWCCAGAFAVGAARHLLAARRRG
jgi:GT2 family glycosyltransferase